MAHPDLDYLVRHLQQTLGERLDAVVLFGSRARGEARPESDWEAKSTPDALGALLRRGRPRSPDPRPAGGGEGRKIDSRTRRYR